MIDLQETFKAGPIFFAFDDLLQTVKAYFAMVRLVKQEWVCHLLLALFLRMFPDPTLDLVFALWSLYVRERSRTIPMKTGLKVYANRFLYQLTLSWR